MIKEIVDAQNPVLRKRAKPVSKIDKKIKALIKDLIDTIKVQKDPEGVGLAAPQIGRDLQIFIIKPENEARVFINPKIIKVWKTKGKNTKDPKKNIMEGCLSLPNYYSPVKRAYKVTLSYIDQKGQKKTEIFTGIDAQIIQHEVDHLNGKLFVDRILEQKKPLYEYIDGDWEEVDLL